MGTMYNLIAHTDNGPELVYSYETETLAEAAWFWFNENGLDEETYSVEAA